jgi:hypothetical protein
MKPTSDQLFVASIEFSLKHGKLQIEFTKMFLDWLQNIEARLTKTRELHLMRDVKKQAVIEKLDQIDLEVTVARDALLQRLRRDLAKRESEHEMIEADLAILRKTL